MFKKLRRRLHESRVRPGDGSSLQEYRFWQLFSRSLFFVELGDETGRRHVFEVDVRHGADSTTKRSPASLYRDGVQVHRATVPVAFPVPGGTIEVATSQYGVKRMHYVRADGSEQPLRPHPRSQEGLRTRFGHRHPRTDAVLNVVGLVVMLIGLVVTLSVMATQVTRVPETAAFLGTVVPPLPLPTWAKTALAVAGGLAGVDRALRLRSTWMAGG